MLEDALPVADVAVGIGATVIITLSRLFRWLQDRAKFYRCPLCVGFWVGAFIETLNQYQAQSEYFEPLEAFKMGCIVSISSYSWFLLMKVFIDKYD